MAISTYAELQTAIANWMHRDNLTGTIPDFIRLAELRIRTRLQERVSDVTATISTVANIQSATLPTDLLSIKSLTIAGSSPTLDYMTPNDFNQLFQPTVVGVPRCYTIVGNTIYFGPTPDAVYSITAMYRFDMPTLSDSAPTNALLTKWPNIYLFGSLVEAAEFSRDFPLRDTYQARFVEAVEGANVLDFNKSGPMRVRTDMRNW